jgi:hypothetical protein
MKKNADLFYSQFSETFSNALEAEILPSNNDDILFDFSQNLTWEKVYWSRLAGKQTNIDPDWQENSKCLCT